MIPYDTGEEAAVIANDTPYGLSGVVWGPDDKTALDFAQSMPTGQVDINGSTSTPWPSSAA